MYAERNAVSSLKPNKTVKLPQNWAVHGVTVTVAPGMTLAVVRVWILEREKERRMKWRENRRLAWTVRKRERIVVLMANCYEERESAVVVVAEEGGRGKRRWMDVSK